MCYYLCMERLLQSNIVSFLRGFASVVVLFIGGSKRHKHGKAFSVEHNFLYGSLSGCCLCRFVTRLHWFMQGDAFAIEHNFLFAARLPGVRCHAFMVLRFASSASLHSCINRFCSDLSQWTCDLSSAVHLSSRSYMRESSLLIFICSSMLSMFYRLRFFYALHHAVWHARYMAGLFRHAEMPLQSNIVSCLAVWPLAGRTLCHVLYQAMQRGDFVIEQNFAYLCLSFLMAHGLLIIVNEHLDSVLG